MTIFEKYLIISWGILIFMRYMPNELKPDTESTTFTVLSLYLAFNILLLLGYFIYKVVTF